MTAETTNAGRVNDPTTVRARLQISDASRLQRRSAELPITRDLRVAYASSLLVATLIAVVSAAGFVFGYAKLYGVDPKVAAMITPGPGGLLIPGFQAPDLVVGLPILIGSLWLAARRSLTGLPVWPGALFYVLYTFALYLVGAPFNALFLVYVGLVVVSAYTAIADCVKWRLWLEAGPPRASGCRHAGVESARARRCPDNRGSPTERRADSSDCCRQQCSERSESRPRAQG